MKPAPFAFHDPAELEEALALLAEHGDDAKVIAGSQTLGPMLNMRLLTPERLVDINRIAALDYRRDASGGLAIGALTRQSALEDDRSLARRQPLVAEAVPWIAHRPIRNRGTVGGSLVHADPAAEWGGLACALDAEMVIARAGAAPRTVAAADFFVALLTTAVEPDELLVEIRLPRWEPATGGCFLEFARRRGDFALAGVACRVALDEQRRCRDPRIALIGVGDTPLRARAAEALLAGEAPGAELYAAAAAEASREAEPLDDPHASAAYRRHLVGVLVEDALAAAVDRARNEES